MKKQIIILFMAVLSVSLYAQNTQDIPEAFKKQLGEIFIASVAMTDNLVDSDAAKTKGSAVQVKSAIEKVDMKLLRGEAHINWMRYLKDLNESIDIIAGSDDLKVQRNAFATFSQVLYASLKSFGITGIDAIYYQYCPMALSDQGAYWLSASKEIRNPYFGEMMLKCGSTKETLEF